MDLSVILDLVKAVGNGDEMTDEPGNGEQAAEALSQDWDVDWVDATEFIVEL